MFISKNCDKSKINRLLIFLVIYLNICVYFSQLIKYIILFIIKELTLLLFIMKQFASVYLYTYN